MSKTNVDKTDAVNENEVSIRKHWIVFVKFLARILFTAVIVFGLYYLCKWCVIHFNDQINETLGTKSLEYGKYILPILIAIFVITAIINFVRTLVNYKTVGASVNNIRIRARTEGTDNGSINANLEQIAYVKLSSSLIGKMLHYGNIEISLSSIKFRMADMMDAENFQEKIVLLQETQRESRSTRESEEQEKNENEVNG